jgi:transketolase
LVEASKLVEKEGFNVRIVSVPSEGLFRNQSKEYQQEVFPVGIKRFGLTSGLPVTLEGLVGDSGTVWGLNSFGYSAPYTVLDDKLGFTPEKVSNQIMKLL